MYLQVQAVHSHPEQKHRTWGYDSVHGGNRDEGDLPWKRRQDGEQRQILHDLHELWEPGVKLVDESMQRQSNT